MEDDPFACFDDDDDDSGSNSSPTIEETKRDPSCGILAFHAGTEQALLKHVESKVASSNAGSLDPSFVLESVDEFCMHRHWMMHVGPKKAPIIQDFIKQCCSDKTNDKPLIVVELGTYTGYSSIMISKALRDLKREFEFYSVEVVEENAQVAKELVRLAGLDEDITILLLDPQKETLSSLLDRSMRTDTSPKSTIDFLFIDHDKSLYLSDLQQLESTGFLQKGCYVAADNVVFAGIDEYRDYMKDLITKGVAKSRLVDTWLEYCEPDFVGDENRNNLMKDGVGKFPGQTSILDSLVVLCRNILMSFVSCNVVELSIYLKNPDTN
jgi:catechol O-methyltransferase